MKIKDISGLARKEIRCIESMRGAICSTRDFESYLSIDRVEDVLENLQVFKKMICDNLDREIAILKEEMKGKTE